MYHSSIEMTSTRPTSDLNCNFYFGLFSDKTVPPNIFAIKDYMKTLSPAM